MENDNKDKKLSNLEKVRDLLNIETLNMKNEIMTIDCIKNRKSGQ